MYIRQAEGNKLGQYGHLSETLAETVVKTNKVLQETPLILLSATCAVLAPR